MQYNSYSSREVKYKIRGSGSLGGGSSCSKGKLKISREEKYLEGRKKGHFTNENRGKLYD